MDQHWEGILPALWSPTDSEGNILEDELRKNLKFILDRNIHGILALGSTGEFLFLERKAKIRLLEITLECAGSIPTIVNISDVRPKQVARMAKIAREIGAAAVTVLPPYFYLMAQPDLTEFFVRAGEAAQLPLFLYNFPERAGTRIGLDTVAAVSDRVHLAGVKQSGAEFGYHTDLVKLGREKGFVVLTGSDTSLVEAMQIGVTGCVSGLSNAVPEITMEIYNAVKQGTPELASTASARMKTLGEIVDSMEFPSNVAAIIEARGLTPGHPKQVVSSQTKAAYEKLVAEFRALFRKWELSSASEL